MFCGSFPGGLTRVREVVVSCTQHCARDEDSGPTFQHFKNIGWTKYHLEGYGEVLVPPAVMVADYPDRVAVYESHLEVMGLGRMTRKGKAKAGKRGVA